MNSAPEKSQTIGIVAESDSQSKSWHLHQNLSEYDDEAMDTLESSDDYDRVVTYDMNWNRTDGGTDANSDMSTENYNGVVTTNYSNGTNMNSFVGPYWKDDDGNGVNWWLGSEHADVKTNDVWSDSGYDEDGFYVDSSDLTYKRSAQTKYTLLSGGRAIPGKMILHDITASAASVPYFNNEPEQYSPNGWSLGVDPHGYPPTSIKVCGKTLQDGHLWVVEPYGAGPIDATPQVNGGGNHYTAAPSIGISVFAHTNKVLAAGDPSPIRTTLGVGEEVYLYGSASGGAWTASDGSITTDGQGKLEFVAPSYAASGVKVQYANAYQKPVEFDFQVVPPSGIDHAQTNSVTHVQPPDAGITMNLTVWIAPISVSFYNVQVWEVPGPAINVQGFFTNDAPTYTNLWHHPNPVPVQLGSDNSFIDTAGFAASAGGQLVWPGEYDWDIPFRWKVAGTSETNNLPNHLQEHIILPPVDPNIYCGSKEIKFGQSATYQPH